MKTNDNEARYMITAATDPYHSQTRYPRGAKVLNRDGATPVVWVQDDNFGRGYDLDEAMRLLEKFAAETNGGQTFWHDDESAKVEVPARDEDGCETDETETACFDGYEGEGLYDCDGSLIYRKGDRGYSYDVMSYEVRPLEEER